MRTSTMMVVCMHQYLIVARWSMLVAKELFFCLEILSSFCMLFLGPAGYGRRELISNRASGSRQQELAVFVRHLDFQAQFYTMSGRWVHRTAKHPQFYVPNFVEAQELDGIKQYLPQEAVPAELEDKLHAFDIVPPRNIGQPLTSKMTAFLGGGGCCVSEGCVSFRQCLSDCGTPKSIHVCHFGRK